MLDVSIVVGNPKPNSRTRKVAEAFVGKLLRGVQYELRTIDLADHIDDMFRWPSNTLDALNKKVALSHIAVFASPTYKATYTGLLKAFLDRYSAGGLDGVAAIPLHTGADLTHSMGPTENLAPLLMELGAVVPGRGFYFVIDQMDRLDEIVEGAASQYRRNFARLGIIASELSLSR